jgi:hypothetical protein
VLNVTYPLVPEQVADFCVGKRSLLVVEEGQPEYIEQDIATLLRRRDIQTPLHGKDLLPAAGEYSVEVLSQGLSLFASSYLPGPATESVQAVAVRQPRAPRRRRRGPGQAAAQSPADLLHRLPGAARLLGAQAHAAGAGARARCRRHRLPCLRHVRALLDGQLDPGLRHEPGQPGRVSRR